MIRVFGYEEREDETARHLFPHGFVLSKRGNGQAGVLV